MKNKVAASSRVFDYSKFHSIHGFTFPNLVASTYGIEALKWNQFKYER